MNYYKRHLGDYAKDTKTLSVYEHGVYTVVLDEYYAQERPLTNDEIESLCRPTTAKERASVEKVMGRYFKRDDKTWRHNYADRVISVSKEKSNKASKSAGKRWHEKENANAMRTHSESYADGMRTHSEGNATRARVTLATSHKPLGKEESKEAACAAEKPREPSASQPQTPEEILWCDGLKLLSSSAKVSDLSARALLGRAVKVLGVAGTLAVIGAAADAKTGDPKSYLAGAIRKREAEVKTPAPPPLPKQWLGHDLPKNRAEEEALRRGAA